MELTEMKNIGTEMNKKLNEVGIKTAADLEKLGSKETYFRLKTTFPNVCLVHLYSLQGAIDDIEYNMLPEKTKRELKNFSDSLK